MKRLQLFTALLAAAGVFFFATPAVWTCAEAGLFMSCEPDHHAMPSSNCHHEPMSGGCCKVQAVPDAVPPAPAEQVEAVTLLTTTELVPRLHDALTEHDLGNRLAHIRLSEQDRYVLSSAYLL